MPEDNVFRCGVALDVNIALDEARGGVAAAILSLPLYVI